MAAWWRARSAEDGAIHVAVADDGLMRFLQGLTVVRRGIEAPLRAFQRADLEGKRRHDDGSAFVRAQFGALEVIGEKAISFAGFEGSLGALAAKAVAVTRQASLRKGRFLLERGRMRLSLSFIKGFQTLFSVVLISFDYSTRRGY